MARIDIGTTATGPDVHALTRSKPYTVEGQVRNYGIVAGGLKRSLRAEKRWVRWTSSVIAVVMVLSVLAAII